MKYILSFLFLGMMNHIHTALFPIGLMILAVVAFASGMVIRPTVLFLLGIGMCLPESFQDTFGVIGALLIIAAIVVRCLGGGFSQDETNRMAAFAGLASGFFATMAFLKRR